jgi:hypothetical protein
MGSVNKVDELVWMKWLCVAGNFDRCFLIMTSASRGPVARDHRVTLGPRLRLLPHLRRRRFDASLLQSLHSNLQPNIVRSGMSDESLKGECEPY